MMAAERYRGMLEAVGGFRRIRWLGESRLYYAACVLLIIVAAGLRFHDLPSNSLWLDEALAANNTHGTLHEAVGNTRIHNSSPILWPLGLWAIQKFDNSHVSLRIVPATASTLTVAALVLLLPRVGFRRSVAFLAGVLMTVSTAAIHEAQDVREYSIDVLLATILMVSALLYLTGRKKWLLLVAMFLAPLLQYGLALFAVAVLMMIVARRWYDSGGVHLKTFVLSFSLPPVVALAGGSILTWAITLRYHGVGFAKEAYLDAYYYQGDLTDIPAIVTFLYRALLDVMDYHVETIPAVAVLLVIIIAAIVSKKFRLAETTLLLAFAMIVGMVASLIGMYPLGGTRQSLILGPIIAVSFVYALWMLAELILAKFPSFNQHSPIFYRSFATVLPLTICIAGFSDIAKYRNVYAGQEEILPVLRLLEQQEEDGDIVLWPYRAGAALRYYDSMIPDRNMRCHSMEECMAILRDLPDEITRIWLAPYYFPHGNAMYAYTLLAHAFDQSLVEMKLDATISLLLVSDAQLAAEYLTEFDNDASIMRSGDLIFRHDAYEIYLNNKSLLYIYSGNCEDPLLVSTHIFASNPDDLPVSSRKYGFENRDFVSTRYGNVVNGQCMVVRFLPDYEIDRIVVGKPGEWGKVIALDSRLGPADITRDFLDNLGEPVLEERPWGVYRMERHVVYVADCENDRDDAPFFFLHIFPADVHDLPDESREFGFENRDFRFQDYAIAVEGACVAPRPLPDYPITSIHTGQYVESGRLWTAELEWGPENPSVE